MPTDKTPHRRQALIRLSQRLREPAFDRRVTAACMELRAARDRVRSRHGEVVLREAEREVFGK